MQFWDWRSGYCFQKMQTTVQPGSLDSEAGIFAAVFDMSGCRLITAEADKTIKIYKEDEDAVSKACCSKINMAGSVCSSGSCSYCFMFESLLIIVSDRMCLVFRECFDGNFMNEEYNFRSHLVPSYWFPCEQSVYNLGRSGYH